MVVVVMVMVVESSGLGDRFRFPVAMAEGVVFVGGVGKASTGVVRWGGV